MTHRLRRAALVLCPLLVLGACASDDEVARGPGDAAATAALEAPAGATSPESPRDRARREAWEAAIAGIRFDADGVTVTEPLGTDEADATALVRDAAARLDANRRTEAVAAAVRAIRVDATRSDAHVALGRALVAKGDLERALSAWRGAAALDAGAVEPRYEIALTQARLGALEAAIEAMQDVLALAPADGRAHGRLAVWHAYRGEDAEAWRHVRAAEAAGEPAPPQVVRMLEARRTGG